MTLVVQKKPNQNKTKKFTGCCLKLFCFDFKCHPNVTLWYDTESSDIVRQIFIGLENSLIVLDLSLFHKEKNNLVHST